MSEFAFKPGYIIITEFAARGGVTYDREQIRQGPLGLRGIEAEMRTIKRVDDVELHRGSRSVMSAAYHAVAITCAQTPIGHYANEIMLAELHAKLVPVRIEARRFNAQAHANGSARRVTVEVYPLELRVDNEHAAQRLARSVRERLEELAAVLRSGELEGFRTVFDRCRNLDKLATGIQADSVRIAVEAANEARRELTACLKEGDGPAIAAEKISSLLEPIDQAARLFTEADDLVDYKEVG